MPSKPHAATLRQQASTCRYLARRATELWVSTLLSELAEDFFHRADRVEMSAVPVRAGRPRQVRRAR
jgi:hypothetical protein